MVASVSCPRYDTTTATRIEKERRRTEKTGGQDDGRSGKGGRNGGSIQSGRTAREEEDRSGSGSDGQEWKTKLKVLFANTQSIVNKIDEARAVVLNLAPDIIAFTET